MRVPELRKLAGKRLQWHERPCPHRGTFFWRYGTLDRVEGKNVFMDDGNVHWLPDMHELQEKQGET